MNEKEIIIPQFAMETGELADFGGETCEPDGGLISRDEITVIIYEVDGLYLTEEEYYAYLQEQSEIYQSQLDAYNEAVSQAQTEARMKADEFVASLRPDVSDRVEDYVGPSLGPRLGSQDGRGQNSAFDYERRGAGDGMGEKKSPSRSEDGTLSFTPEHKGRVPGEEKIEAAVPLPAVRPELPTLFGGEEISTDCIQALKTQEGLTGASVMPGLSGYGPGESGRDSERFADRWRNWPKRRSIGNNRIISGMLFEPGE